MKLQYQICLPAYSEPVKSLKRRGLTDTAAGVSISISPSESAFMGPSVISLIEAAFHQKKKTRFAIEWVFLS
ncbi:MAG: hypothetical protein LKI04_02810 [Paenibacillus lautus]|jgi:hypothetical protein|uniref:hypothetical protein n=1 Tax=Paenibacillus lautus TaxID=1401 RepID=UPI0026EF25E5|nr:hypothetical protein [Paenibacillus lautus]MCI1772905.1 hypothetical protein [Paenibacillus lautus]